MVITVPQELDRAHKPPERACDGLEDIPQVWGAFPSAPILQGHPLLLRAEGVLGDAQLMGSHDWALCLVCRVEDGSSYSGGVFMALYSEV